jgi:hypothetical protein
MWWATFAEARSALEGTQPPPQAVTAHAVALDGGDLEVEGGGELGGHQAGRAHAHEYQVVFGAVLQFLVLSNG